MGKRVLKRPAQQAVSAKGSALEKIPKAKPVLKRPAKAQAARGKADSLVGSSFKAWVEHVKTNSGPTWLFVLIQLQHLLCCRVTECLKLRFRDIELEASRVLIGPLKKHGAKAKPLSEVAKQLLTGWKDQGGCSFQRTRKWGNRGIVTYKDEWVWAADADAYLFPVDRKDSNKKHRNKARCPKTRCHVANASARPHKCHS